MVLFVTLFLVGCNVNVSDSKNIKKIDSKIDYILFRDKKIYLSDNFNDFVLQFKGLSCKLNALYASNYFDKINIDDIDSKEHVFYDISTDGSNTNQVAIECDVEGSYFPSTFNMWFEYDNEVGEVLYSEREMDSWSISPNENIDVYIDGKKISYGDDDKSIVTMNDVEKILGKNYELDDVDMVYEFGDYDHEFHFYNDKLLIITIEK